MRTENMVLRIRVAAQAEALRDLGDSHEELMTVLQEAVDLYGKPGGPWNVPSDPGGWISKARKALNG